MEKAPAFLEVLFCYNMVYIVTYSSYKFYLSLNDIPKHTVCFLGLEISNHFIEFICIYLFE